MPECPWASFPLWRETIVRTHDPWEIRTSSTSAVLAASLMMDAASTTEVELVWITHRSWVLASIPRPKHGLFNSNYIYLWTILMTNSRDSRPTTISHIHNMLTLMLRLCHLCQIIQENLRNIPLNCMNNVHGGCWLFSDLDIHIYKEVNNRSGDTNWPEMPEHAQLLPNHLWEIHTCSHTHISRQKCH